MSLSSDIILIPDLILWFADAVVQMNDVGPNEPLDLTASNQRLNEFLDIPVETRTFPACLVEPVAVEPLRSAPAAAGGEYLFPFFWYTYYLQT